MKGVAILMILAVIALLLCIPFIGIWAVNTLFPVLDVQYTLNTWVAVIALYVLIKYKWR